jgi:hypothetical protein
MRETTMQSGRLVRGSDRVVDKRAWISAREDVESGSMSTCGERGVDGTIVVCCVCMHIIVA